MANNKIQLADGRVLIDLTEDTVTPSTLLKGETAHGADGVQIVGTFEPQSGGDGGPVAEKDVNFFDYDGTLLYSYTLDEAKALTELPKLPSRPGLVCQGWNWEMADIKTLTGPMNIGAMYITDDGKTRLHIRLADIVRNVVPLYFSQTVANGVVIDWGDGSATQTLSGTGNVKTTHTYAEAGAYTITLGPKDGCTLGLGHGTNAYCVLGSTANAGRVYGNMLKEVNLGRGINNLSMYAFYYCGSLSSITIPSEVRSIRGSAFYYCGSLSSITIPSGVASIENNEFGWCGSLSSITIPSGLTSIKNGAFYNCYSLSSITIPSGVASIGSSAFYHCYSLSSITIPSGVASIGSGAFSSCTSLSSITIPSGVASIGSSAFSSCTSLSSIIIPSGVASIGSSAFSNCYGLGLLRFLPVTPPTVSSANAFNGIPTDCLVAVPFDSIAAYQAATNYASIAAQMRGVR